MCHLRLHVFYTESTIFFAPGCGENTSSTSRDRMAGTIGPWDWYQVVDPQQSYIRGRLSIHRVTLSKPLSRVSYMRLQSPGTNNRHSIAPILMEGRARESKSNNGGKDWASPDLYNCHQASTTLPLFYFISFIPFLVGSQVHQEAWRRARERWGEGRPVSLGSTGWGGYCCCSRVSRPWQRSPLA